MNQKEIKELIEFLVEKDIAEFELQRGDVKLLIKRGAAPTGAVVQVTPATVIPGHTVAAVSAPAACTPYQSVANCRCRRIRKRSGPGATCRRRRSRFVHPEIADCRDLL